MEGTSRNFSFTFSNTPGPIKRLVSGTPGNESIGTYTCPYVLVAGRVGMSVSLISMVEHMKISVLADKSICQDTRFLVDKIERNILSEIERMKDVPAPPPGESKKTK